MAGNSEEKGLAKCKRILTVALTMFLCGTMLLFPVSAGESLDSAAVSTGKVTIVIGDRKTPMSISGRPTVGALVEKMGITLTELDNVNLPINQKVKNGDVITIKRREYVTQKERGVIPFQTVYHYSQDVNPGKETVLVEGVDGFGEQTFKRLLEDGKMVSQELIEEKLSKAPVTKEVSIGFRSKPTSDFDFDWEFNDDGEPLNAVNVLRNQKSTAYTARPNSLTASGRAAQVGHVAVNPNVIPYGSKLFIQGTDGQNLVYGYAVAADTGTALLDGRSNLDLYYDSMGECVSHGVKYMDIFVLETPQ